MAIYFNKVDFTDVYVKKYPPGGQGSGRRRGKEFDQGGDNAKSGNHNAKPSDHHAAEADDQPLFRFFDIAFDLGDIALGCKLVFDERALFVGDCLGLGFWHAGGGEAFDVFVRVEGSQGHVSLTFKN